jgi:TIR domain
MAAAWLTYSWADNKAQDVDYIAQELRRAGLTVHLDKWDLQAGKRLWEQIAGFITDPSKTDAWIIYATANSLSSEKCKEELYYAVDRALGTRDESFPVVALFPSAAEIDLLPPALKTRLNVSLEDPQWTERIVAAAERRQPAIDRAGIGPYAIAFHRTSSRHFVEIRPRAGVVSSFFVAIPVNEKDAVDPSIHPGPSGRIPRASIVQGAREFCSETEDGTWWVMTADNQATPTTSYFLQCRELPTRIAFGDLAAGADQQYVWTKPGS